MQFSSLARHAVYAIVFLARHQHEPRISAEQMADTLGLPRLGLPRFLLGKALETLAKAGLVHSIKGLSGGYRLVNPANKITLLEVVETVDGRIAGDLPAFGHAAGKGVDRRLQARVDRATEDYRRGLGKVRTADLARH